jgi:hypothetical protein
MTMTDDAGTGWPFDAYRDDPLTALRIPVIGSPYPRYRYEVALVCPDSPAGQDLYPALRPDGAETAAIAAYLELRMERYDASWKAKMRRRPLDTDSGANTVILWKHGTDNWCYRRSSWRSGALVVPSTFDGEGPVGLDALLDRITGEFTPGTPGSRWQEWKTAHPELFAAPD